MRFRSDVAEELFGFILFASHQTNRCSPSYQTKCDEMRLMQLAKKYFEQLR